jgi:threonine dehydrogenase-like Zn-dependent dehydrogenase
MGKSEYALESKAEFSIRMVFGRCSVRTFLPEAIRLLKANLDLFETFVEEIVSMEKAPEYYERFERNEILVTRKIRVRVKLVCWS